MKHIYVKCFIIGKIKLNNSFSDRTRAVQEVREFELKNTFYNKNSNLFFNIVPF